MCVSEQVHSISLFLFHTTDYTARINFITIRDIKYAYSYVYQDSPKIILQPQLLWVSCHSPIQSFYKHIKFHFFAAIFRVVKLAVTSTILSYGTTTHITFIIL